MKKEFNILNIADIHWGATKYNKLYKELTEYFIKYLISKKDIIDMVCILGDYFDNKLYLNSKDSIYAIKFFNQLLNLCNKYNIKLRIIKGTKTHDFNQLDNFDQLESTYNNLKIIKTVTEEEIDHLKILYVPEEYMNDEKEFYKDYKNKNYDIIMGHGTWDICAFQNQILESERNISNSPVFIYKEWENIVNYYIMFGHIHTRQHYKKLYYPGSYSRWIFGEEKTKGFYHSIINLEDKKYKMLFIENKLATKYETINLSSIINKEDSIEDIINKINNVKNDNTKIKIDNNIEKDKLEIIKETFSSDNTTKIELKSIKDKIEEEVNNELDFLGNDILLNIKNYIKYKFNEEVSIEKINELTTEDIE